jgi:hypothetical protein
MKPEEFAYYQLIDGMMYPAKNKKGALVSKNKPVGLNVINAVTRGKTQPQTTSNLGTVTPKFSVVEDED